MNKDLTQRGSTSGGVHRFRRGAGAQAAAALERIHAVLRRDEERCVRAIQAAIRSELPALEAVPDADLLDSIRLDYRRALAALSEPGGGEGAAPARTRVAARPRRACTAEQVTAARRVGVRRIWELLGAAAAGDGIDEAARLEGLYAMWEWADAVQAEEAAELRGAGGAADDRSWFVRGLLSGTLPANDLRSRASAYGILPGARYRAFRARPAGGADEGELANALEASGGQDGFGVLVASVDGDVCGVVSRMPRIDGDAAGAATQGIVGVGFEAELTRLSESFRVATRVLETAIAFELDGVLTIDDLSLRPAILTESHLGDRLVRRYLEPLATLGEFGVTVEDTLRAYLGHGMRIDESARSLYVHPNTLRHRLDRFQQLTGADLRRTQDVLELWWALERRRLPAAS